jgi:multidrug efflux pump
VRFTDLFIRRPVIATVVNLLILLAGGQAVRSLSVREYPKTDISVITVQTTYYGADAELVRGFITTPLEQAISGVEGIDYMDSESTLGTSTISVHLKLNFDPDAAITLIQSKVSEVRNQLPPASQIPVIKITSPDTDFAAMYLSFSSDELDRNQITDYLTRIVQPKLAAIVGVQEARIVGGRVFAMRIWLDNQRMAALNVNPTDVENILQTNNYLSAAGQTKGSMTAINLVANTNLQSVEDFKQLAVKQANGAIVRLKDIARVELGAESYDSEVRFQGRTATFIGINALPTANTLDVIKRVRDVLPELAKQLPAGLKADVAYDSTEYITAAINDVMETLIETHPNRDDCDLLIHGVPPGRGDSGGGHSAFFDRSDVPPARARLYSKPPDHTGDRTCRGVGSRRRDCRGRERAAEYRGRSATVRSCDQKRPRTF